MNKEKISIVVASDNHYAILIASLLKSIDFNHKTSEHIDFYILDDGISKESKNKINSIVSDERFTLIWAPANKLISSKIDIPSNTSSFPSTAFLRIFSPYIVDQNIEKLIYLDVDTLVQEDISKLWNIELGDYNVAAVQDLGKTIACKWGGIPNYKELGLLADTKYFNSGVMLFNPKKWRIEKIDEKIFEALTIHKKHVRLPDQYGLNLIFLNRWLELDPKWNWFAHLECSNPYIIHFLDVKPIFTSYNSQPDYKKEFFRYLEMTPWKNFKPQSGHRRTLRKIYTKIKNRLTILFHNKD
jgi:lipopolysaccharide biosynthesis glycosyltransferase